MLTILDTTDVIAIQIDTNIGTITIFNIYNDCNNDKAQNALDKYIEHHVGELYSPSRHVLWCGNFN